MLTCQAEGIWFAYQEKRWILKGVSLEVPEGAFLAVVGPSGSGKTTLMKVLAGLLKPQCGSVELLGQPMCQGVDTALRRQIGYIPQQLGLVRGITALENVLLGALGRMPGIAPLLGVFSKQEVEHAREYLAFLGIEHKAHEKVYCLSGGERQRVAIARTLLQKPKVVFADEFVSDLDLPRAAQILQAMRELGRRDGVAFVINLHEISLVQEMGDGVIVLKDGNILQQGLAQQMTFTVAREVLA